MNAVPTPRMVRTSYRTTSICENTKGGGGLIRFPSGHVMLSLCVLEGNMTLFNQDRAVKRNFYANTRPPDFQYPEICLR
jgi:hypothetical protein